MRARQSLHVLSLFGAVLFALVSSVAANTEIINFAYPQHFPDLPASIDAKPSFFAPLNEQIRFTIPVQGGDLDQAGQGHVLVEFAYELTPGGVRANFERWHKQSLGLGAKRTARLSWPASHPIDLELELFAIPMRCERKTIRFGGYLLVKYRINADHRHAPSPLVPVPVTLIVEPCWLGGIPESLLGALVLIAACIGVLVVGRVPQRVTNAIRGTRQNGREKAE